MFGAESQRESPTKSALESLTKETILTKGPTLFEARKQAKTSSKKKLEDIKEILDAESQLISFG